MRCLQSAITLFLLLSVLTGLIYPLAVTAIAQLVFPHRANGSLIVAAGSPVGSKLIGQSFRGGRYFWPRPSATSPAPYNATASSGSNLGPLNPQLVARIEQQAQSLRAAHPDQQGPIPVDLLTASGSGLDPHISPAAANYQIARVARQRGLDEARVRELVAEYTEGRQFGLLGEPRVNVLRLNLALDRTASP